MVPCRDGPLPRWSPARVAWVKMAEISAVFVAAPLRVLELLFFSCLPVCPYHAV